MKNIDHLILPGMRIRRVSEILVSNAPAYVDVNTVRMRARYATTQARDIEAQYWRSLESPFRVRL